MLIYIIDHIGQQQPGLLVARLVENQLIQQLFSGRFNLCEQPASLALDE